MERRCGFRSKKLLAALTAGVLLILSGTAWLKRTSLLVSYSVHRLISAKESDQQDWVERVAALDRAAMPKLIDCLRHHNAQVCAKAEAALLAMAQRWGSDDVREAELAEDLAKRFASLSEPGQQAALQIQDQLVRASAADPAAADLLPAVAATLAEAARTANTEVHARALALAASLTQQSTRSDWTDAGRKLTQRCLSDEAPANRIEAIRFALRSEIGLQQAVVPLLSDPVPEVRRVAMLGVGTAPDAIDTDDLLRWLHDPDPLVRNLCENALRSRGLKEEHLKLGRLMTDHRPGVRIQVIQWLRRANDLEPGVWLRRLSHDPAPAVRAAAVRAATEQEVLSLKDRLEQMAQNDACASVRQLAQYYLTSQKSRSAVSVER